MPQRNAERQPVAVVIVDDNQLLAHGLRAHLEADERIDVVAVAGSGKAALAAAVSQPLDVALVEVDLVAESGIEIVRMLTTVRPELAVIAMGDGLGLDERLEAHAAGAVAVLEKDELVRSGRERVLGCGELAPLAAARGDAA